MGWVNMQPDDDTTAAMRVQRAFPDARVIYGRVHLTAPSILSQLKQEQQQAEAAQSANIIPAPKAPARAPRTPHEWTVGRIGQRVWQWLTSWRR
jgi:hypothetical protein